MLKTHNENLEKLQKFFENEKFKDANVFLEKIIINSQGINRLDMYRALAIISY